MSMKIKRYLEFSRFGAKEQLLLHLDQNREDIERNGLDFDSVKTEVANVLDQLDDSFVQSIVDRFSSIPKEGEEYRKAFEEIMAEVLHELKHGEAAKNEGIKDFFSSIWNKIAAVGKWISDRSFTLIGSASLSIGLLLAGSLFLGHGPEMSEIAQNVTINGLIGFGITALSFGLKNDEFNQDSDI